MKKMCFACVFQCVGVKIIFGVLDVYSEFLLEKLKHTDDSLIKPLCVMECGKGQL